MMGLLVLTVFWQVFSRYILNAPSTVTDEMARFLLIWVSLLGAAYFSGQNMHIAINLLPDKLNPENRRKLQIFNKLLIIGFVLSVLVIGGGMLSWYTYTLYQITPTLQIPMALVYLIGPVSGLLILYYKISDIIRLVKAPAETDGEDAFQKQDFKGSI